ncbi:MAG: DUF4169 family protein [Aestuariivirga sp.]
MTGDVVSLKLHRKRKAFADKESAAAENRAKYGRSKNERRIAKAERDHAEKRLDGHKIED